MFINWILRKLTNNNKEIPLFAVTLDLNKYRKSKNNSCMIHVHPNYKNDDHIDKVLKDLTDYIRNTYNMENLI
jgi:hypothetical protein